jgi:hypothetical protein
VFRRGEDPSAWIGERLARVMPALVADLHRDRNDDRDADDGQAF